MITLDLSSDKLSALFSTFTDTWENIDEADFQPTKFTVFNAKTSTIPFAYEWTISNFKCPKNVESIWIYSPEFSPKNIDCLKFLLAVTFNESNMLVIIRLKSSPVSSLFTNVKATLLD